jgi:hypothetical protein
MRQLITKVLAVAIFIPSLAWSFSDPVTMMAVEVAHQEIQQATRFSTKMRSILHLRKLVNERLNTMDIPNPLLLANNDPRLEDFRSLNEFEGYLDLMVSQRVNADDCSRLAAQIRMSAVNTRASSEAQVALDLLKAICQ